jgi:hypothetical protein
MDWTTGVILQRQQGLQFNVPNGKLRKFHMRLWLFQIICVQTRGSMPATLLPSASCSLKHAVSAPARKPLRIFRHMLSVSMNYFKKHQSLDLW